MTGAARDICRKPPVLSCSKSALRCTVRTTATASAGNRAGAQSAPDVRGRPPRRQDRQPESKDPSTTAERRRPMHPKTTSRLGVLRVGDINDQRCGEVAPEPLWLPAQLLLPDAPQKCAWSALPPSCGVSTPDRHRRFTEWVEADVFARLHQMMLEPLGSAGAIDCSRARWTTCRSWRSKAGPDRAQPGGSGQARQQDPRHERPQRPAADCGRLCGQPQRPPGAGGRHRRCGPDQGPARRHRRQPRKPPADKDYDW